MTRRDLFKLFLAFPAAMLAAKAIPAPATTTPTAVCNNAPVWCATYSDLHGSGWATYDHPPTAAELDEAFPLLGRGKTYLIQVFCSSNMMFNSGVCCVTPWRVDVNEISSGTECADSNGPDTKNKLTTREN